MATPATAEGSLSASQATSRVLIGFTFPADLVYKYQSMKVALKYGLLITLGVAFWIILAHTLVPDPNSKVHTLGAGVFFNVIEVAGIYLGIKAKGKEAGGALTFKDGVKTGVSIAFVYAITVSLFFVGVIAFLGTKLMHVDPSMTAQPMSRIE